jgi:uncharacterized protein YdaU (DUF1376 family)
MPLHVSDFLTGTHTLTNEETGAYVRLLFHQWEYDAVPADDRTALAALLHEAPIRAQQLWSRLGPKFRRGTDGRWRNPRAHREREGAVHYSRQQQARAHLRWRSRR